MNQKQNTLFPARLLVFDVLAGIREAWLFLFFFLSFSDSPFLLLLFQPTLQLRETARDHVHLHAFHSLRGRDGVSVHHPMGAASPYHFCMRLEQLFSQCVNARARFAPPFCT
jgi:hypothetical protein